MPGPASQSYGIQVARLAGVPAAVIERAKQILHNLEQGELNDAGQPRLAQEGEPRQRRSSPCSVRRSVSLRDELAALDVDRLTPLDALTRLHALVEAARRGSGMTRTAAAAVRSSIVDRPLRRHPGVVQNADVSVMNPTTETLATFQPDRDWGEQSLTYLQAVKARLFAEHQQGASGTAIVRAYTAAMDHLLATLYEHAAAAYAARFARLDHRFAVVAQGGYGRGELNPGSDIDLLFLYPFKREPFVEYVSERILYTLWDTRLTVGNAVRNVRECARLAAQDFKVKTALLDSRFLCGDQALYRDFAAAMDRDVLKRGSDRFFAEKLAENAERHARYGDSVYLLEPQLKEGEGGLRDLHTAMWLAKVKFKTNTLVELVQKSVITEREREEMEAARDFLFRVRNALHFLSGKHQDQLTFEYQERIAADLGFTDTATVQGVEHFMRTYYLHAATVNRFADQIIERCIEKRRPYFGFGRGRPRQIRPGVTIADGVLSLDGAEALEADPSNFLRIFGDAQRHDVRIAATTKRLLRAHLHLIEPHRDAPAMSEAFFEILRGKQRVYETLRDMHRAGVLGAYLPEFGALLCMVLHDLYHIYTVDEHSLRGIHELERLRAGEHKAIAPMLTQVMRDADRVEILFLGMLLHDIGKGHGGGHSERGAGMVEAVAKRLRLNTDDAAQLKFLVANHLHMSHLAQRRDIHDQRLVIEFARRVETLDNLKKLYLLTFADMRAVGPKIWNNWHDMLLSELYMQHARRLRTRGVRRGGSCRARRPREAPHRGGRRRHARRARPCTPFSPTCRTATSSAQPRTASWSTCSWCVPSTAPHRAPRSSTTRSATSASSRSSRATAPACSR